MYYNTKCYYSSYCACKIHKNRRILNILKNKKSNNTIALFSISEYATCTVKCTAIAIDDRIKCPADMMCLKSLIRNRCTDDNPVPNVVHYVWFGRRKLAFHHMISMMATAKFIKPCHIMIHGDAIPYGTLWDFLLSKVNASMFIHVPRKQPTSIFGNPVHVIEHRSDLARLEIINGKSMNFHICHYCR